MLWPPPVPGGNELSHYLDRQNDNWNKVSLNLTPFTPMVYHKKRAQHLCFFIISPEVATWQGVMFTNTNAASTNQRRGEGLIGLNLINFEAIRSKPQPSNKDGWVRPVQAEVLVLGSIPLTYVSEVVFVSKASLNHAERLWGRLPHPPFSVKDMLFFDVPDPSGTVDFPHVIEFLLTDDVIDKDMARAPHTHKTKYYRRESNRITFLTKVKATAGTKAEVTWFPANLSSETEFPKSNLFYYWRSIPLDKLPNGGCTIEYRLNGLHWVSAEFEVL